MHVRRKYVANHCALDHPKVAILGQSAEFAVESFEPLLFLLLSCEELVTVKREVANSFERLFARIDKLLVSTSILVQSWVAISECLTTNRPKRQLQ